MTTLYTEFNNLCVDFKAGKVGESSLYYLGFTRQHVRDGHMMIAILRVFAHEGLAKYTAICSLLERAENEGRVEWARAHCLQEWRPLCDLLVRNGLKPMNKDHQLGFTQILREVARLNPSLTIR